MQECTLPGTLIPAPQAMQLRLLHEKEEGPMHLPLGIPATSSDTILYRRT
jgi:hypothetical protein